MSQLTTQPAQVPTDDIVRARTSRARTGIIIVMVVAIVLAAVTRDWAIRQRIAASGLPGGASGSAAARSSLGSMNSFSLALLLGGLRGPLVMFLWSTSESQKADKNLEDFDTKVEWIRLLQPEFDTVHIFQVWNKAYNISVQMASLRNKYTTILDALEYAKNVQKGRPDNINLTVSTAQVYSDKLGNSAEKAHYRAWVRQESLPHTPRQRLKRGDPAWRALELDPMLDADGRILPELITPKRTAPPGHEGRPFNDGSELQYLVKYQPFKYGLSPMAIAFNYYKQAQVLQREYKQKHAQLSDLVIDSRPGLTLKQWAEDEMDRGRRNELAAYGLKAPTDINDKVGLELPSINLPLGVTGDAAQIDEAIDAYSLSAVTADDAIAEYEEHLKLYPNNAMTYESHIDGLVGTREMALADRDFLKAQRTTGDERKSLLASAAKHYRDAADQNYRILIRYYTSDEMAAALLPKGMMRPQIKDLPAQQLGRVYAAARAMIASGPGDPYSEDRAEYEAYVTRAEQRLLQCK